MRLLWWPGRLLGWLRLLKGRLGLLRLWLRRRSSAECRACGAAANIAPARIDRPRQVIG